MFEVLHGENDNEDGVEGGDKVLKSSEDFMIKRNLDGTEKGRAGRRENFSCQTLLNYMESQRREQRRRGRNFNATVFFHQFYFVTPPHR